MPSLTLTNPDMILPYEDDRAYKTPSPPQIAYLSHLNSRQSDPNGFMSAPNRQKKNFSRHAWTHDDVNVSRRLSDIGEELSPDRLEGFGDSDEQDLASSSLLHEQVDKDRENAAWSSSNSTISVGSGPASASRDVSEPHNGRDESLVHPEVAKAQATTVVGAAGSSSVPASNAVASAAVEGKGPGEEFSSAILSSEAERILENAKKRLNLMENNLTRARSTTPRTTASPSPSNSGYIQPMGMHHPVGGLYRSISRTDPKNSSLRRLSLVASQDTTNNHHSRVHSETNVPSKSGLSNDNKRIMRSVSAMGASTSSRLHTDNRSFQYAPTRAYLTHRSSVSSTRPPIPVNDQDQQDQTAQSPVSTEDSSPVSPRGLGISSEEGSKSSPDGFSPVYSSFGPPSRAQSQLQVRDLQYQMKGLHIKISSLKVKTQEDNLRRRSLQSLRTPSPLTASDQWYVTALELRDGQSSRGSDSRRDTSSENTRDTSNDVAEDRRRSDQHVAGNTSKHARTWKGNEPAKYADDQSVAETMYEDAEEGDFDGDIDREALNEILREPLDDDLESDMEAFPDVPSHTDATPHEMREDAFDYENFILHSALGNYTQQLRRVSHGSNGSVETTRPTYTLHSRTNSNISESTVATFTTANEGECPDDEDDIDSVMYWDRRFNRELRHGHSHSHSQSHSLRHARSYSHQSSSIKEVEEGDRSETPRGPRYEGGDNTLLNTPHLSSQKFASRSSSATAGSATPTSLVSSLVSTVRAASSTPSVGGINDDDTQMLEELFASLGKVCMDLQAITTSSDPDIKAARVLRRRLDAARRALEGELDS
ncbi:2-oxoacid dehydrogenase acyltransferase [Penicillium digitatum]|uniref:2-oxoacid dehydrogenase acyltransferase n=1 Tax=Penicillium digitatum TaxID=36651 RepID=A0A7T6XST0_PENDI|nr:2-oxoacid dehydrogenase acyltransferase [Penicillium digitatum]